jgi:hypothetical protein
VRNKYEEHETKKTFATMTTTHFRSIKEEETMADKKRRKKEKVHKKKGDAI